MANEIIIIHYIYYMCIYIYIYLSHYIEPILWLVVSTNPSEKWWSSWDWIIIPTIGEHQIHVPVTTNQIYIYIAKPLAGLKRLASFWCFGGGVVHDWCKPGSGRFCASTSRCREQEIWCWKTPFLVSNFNFLVKSWCWKSFFWGSECIFWGSETLMKLLESFHEVAREAWRWWSQRCVCFYFPPLHQNWPTFKANQGISKQIIVFQAVLGFVLSSIFTWQLYTQAQGRKNDRHRVSALCRVWHGFEWALPTWKCISTFRKIKNHPNAHQRRHIAVKITRNHSTLQNPSKPLQIFPNPPNPQKFSPIFPNHQQSPETFPKPPNPCPSHPKTTPRTPPTTPN